MFSKIKDFTDKIKNNFNLSINSANDFVKKSKEKFSNLYQTNYDTGMYHFNHGNLWDASLRFKIIKRFWPNKLEPQYIYAYCLTLQEMDNDAKTLLKEILLKNPEYKDAETLLKKINNNETKQILLDYQKKFEKNNEIIEKVKKDDESQENF